jgi:hypothetical protein
MKISALIMGLLLPAFSWAQDSMPTSAPVAASQPVVEVSASVEQGSSLQERFYDKSSEKAYNISFYSTVTGLAGSFVFTSLGFVALRKVNLEAFQLSNALFSVAGAFGTLSLVGPSLGHFYAGDTERGVKLLVRRAIIPPALLIGGMATVIISGGVLAQRLFNDEPIKAGPFIGIGGGLAIAAAGGISWWILTFKHIEDARLAPARVAAKMGLPLGKPAPKPVTLLPAPMYDPSNQKLGFGATLRLNF